MVIDSRLKFLAYIYSTYTEISMYMYNVLVAPRIEYCSSTLYFLRVTLLEISKRSLVYILR